MHQPFLQRFRLDGFLSFPPGSEPFELRSLNVLIGPNGSGKSNLIEAIELLRATAADFPGTVRAGGGVSEWVWKGSGAAKTACIDAELAPGPASGWPMRHRLEFGAVAGRVEIVDEAIEDATPLPGRPKPEFHYQFRRGNPVIRTHGGGSARHLPRTSLVPDQSILAQRKDPERYPELTWLGQQYGAMQTFREWSFGRHIALRQPQSATLPEDHLLADSSNLALVLNQIDHHDPIRFNQLVRRFFPRFERISTRISGGTVQFYLHESGFAAPIPSSRLSDGTLRFVALLATLLAPSLPPLICIEEPELGLHPDAMSLVAELLLEASERTQLIVTTHSEALVSALTVQPDALITCERPGAGTVLRRLEPAQLTEWLENYRLGDLWRMGELGANP